MIELYVKTKKWLLALVFVIGFLMAAACAASDSPIFAGLFGFLSAVIVDCFIDSFEKKE